MPSAMIYNALYLCEYKLHKDEKIFYVVTYRFNFPLLQVGVTGVLLVPEWTPHFRGVRVPNSVTKAVAGIELNVRTRHGT